MTRLFPAFAFLSLLIFGCCNAAAQTTFLSCEATPTPLVVRSEGITEKTGDIDLKCSGGAPGGKITGNFVLFLSAPITNRISGGNVTDVILTIDTGSGPQSAGVPGVLVNNSAIDFNGVSFTLSPSGTANLRFSEVRVDVTGVPMAPLGSVTAQVTFNPGVILAVPSSLLTVADPRRGLYASLSDNLVCFSQGSLLPNDVTSLAAFFAAKTEFTSTRVTEGFGDALAPRSYATANLNADSGQRIMVNYSGFPAGARLFVPTVVAGSDAVQATAGGDLGVPASGGRYMPGNTGSLLLALVPQARADGSGGTPAYTPGAPGSGTVAFDSMSEIALVNGSGLAVYEVVDANPHIQESAQFPTFLGLAPTGGGTPVVTSETVSLAPVSNVEKATAGDPIPRYAFTPAPPDCGIVGDCGAKYFPLLALDTTSLEYAAPAGSGHQVNSFLVLNRGSGLLNWKATVRYMSGASGWLVIFPDSALNGARMRVDAVPTNLAPGTYTATITVDAGPIAGTKTVDVTLKVTPPVPIPTVTAVVNAASFATAPVVAGSLTTLVGMNLGGKSVAVTLDGFNAAVLFDNDSQINLLVPAGITGRASADLLVVADGVSSAVQRVPAAPFSPAIFKGGILNQDNTVNGPDNVAHPGSVIQVFATGLSGTGTIAAKVGTASGHLKYAGPAPGLDGVQQVNIQLAHDLKGPSVNLVLCGDGVCGPPATVFVSQ